MDIVNLPLLPASTTLSAALEVLDRANVRALVTVQNRRRVVLDERALIAGGRLSATEIGEIAPIAGSIDLPVEADRLSQATADYLDASNAIFAIDIESTLDMAVVVTRHEGVAAAQRGHIGRLVCRGDPPHVWAPGDIKSGNVCPLDLELLDAK